MGLSLSGLFLDVLTYFLLALSKLKWPFSNWPKKRRYWCKFQLLQTSHILNSIFFMWRVCDWHFCDDVSISSKSASLANWSSCNLLQKIAGKRTSKMLPTKELRCTATIMLTLTCINNVYGTREFQVTHDTLFHYNPQFVYPIFVVQKCLFKEFFS